MPRQIRAHDAGLWAGTLILGALTGYDTVSSLAGLAPTLRPPLHADVLACAVAALLLGGFCRFAVRPLREALIHGYRLRAEHEAQQRAAGVEMEPRVPGGAYREVVPPVGATPRHRGAGGQAHGPVQRRSR